MKIKLIKNKSGGPARTCFKGGFALLFSVLVASLLLTIGLSIFSIALKELAISTATRQSIHAFYAAESGRQYALYNDLRLTDNGFFSATEKDTLIAEAAGYSISSPEIPLDVDSSGGPNSKVQIVKIKNGGLLPCNTDLAIIICTTITSYGYDTDSGDKVERAILQTY